MADGGHLAANSLSQKLRKYEDSFVMLVMFVLQIDGDELQEARWFSRDDVISMICDEHPEKLFVPPQQALAHQLIKQWLLRSALGNEAVSHVSQTLYHHQGGPYHDRPEAGYHQNCVALGVVVDRSVAEMLEVGIGRP